MRRCLTIVAALGMVAFALGCGGGASEDKPLDEVKAEAQKLNADQLKAKVEAYQKAIADKQPEIEKLQKELGTGLIAAVTGKEPEDADQLREKLDKLQASVKALTERMEIYAAELKAKQG